MNLEFFFGEPYFAECFKCESASAVAEVCKFPKTFLYFFLHSAGNFVSPKVPCTSKFKWNLTGNEMTAVLNTDNAEL